MSCYRFSTGIDCSYLSAPAKGIPTMAHMGHAASKNKTKTTTNKTKQEQKHADKRVWLKGRALKESKHLLQETRIFFSYQVTINKTLLYKTSKQRDGLETERAKKQQQHRGENNLHAATGLKNRNSHAKIKNRITKDNTIK